MFSADDGLARHSDFPFHDARANVLWARRSVAEISVPGNSGTRRIGDCRGDRLLSETPSSDGVRFCRFSTTGSDE